MEINCPACRKTCPSESQCSRCGADLRTLRQILQTAAQVLASGHHFLRRNEGTKALRAAQSAWHLKHSAAAAQLAFLACLRQRQFAAAELWYMRTTGQP
ncbi:MAG: hypothetical protein WAU91_22500 [Desulfatitalea sp.]